MQGLNNSWRDTNSLGKNGSGINRFLFRTTIDRRNPRDHVAAIELEMTLSALLGQPPRRHRHQRIDFDLRVGDEEDLTSPRHPDVHSSPAFRNGESSQSRFISCSIPARSSSTKF